MTARRIQERGLYQMNNLKCSVDTCGNYKDHRCCLSQIEIAGSSAVNRQETYCESFCPSGCGAQNAVDGTPSQTLHIHCSAYQCVHNQDGGCDAACVCVSAAEAGSENQYDSQCQTFSCKCV